VKQFIFDHKSMHNLKTFHFPGRKAKASTPNSYQIKIEKFSILIFYTDLFRAKQQLQL